jgi:hypothetical protein
MSENDGDKPAPRVRRRMRPVIPTGHTSLSIDEVVLLARAVLDSAPAPLPPRLRNTLSRVVYRCAAAPEAFQNQEWLRLREQVLPPGADPVLDLLGTAIPLVAELAQEAPNPDVDQALAALCDIPEKVLSLSRLGDIPRVVMIELIELVRQHLDDAAKAHRRDTGSSEGTSNT